MSPLWRCVDQEHLLKLFLLLFHAKKEILDSDLDKKS